VILENKTSGKYGYKHNAGHTAQLLVFAGETPVINSWPTPQLVRRVRRAGASDAAGAGAGTAAAATPAAAAAAAAAAVVGDDGVASGEWYAVEDDAKWNCDELRRKINKLTSHGGDMNKAELLRNLQVNSNSFYRFMKMKGCCSGVQNGTFEASHHFFELYEAKKRTEKPTHKAAAAKAKATKAAAAEEKQTTARPKPKAKPKVADDDDGDDDGDRGSDADYA